MISQRTCASAGRPYTGSQLVTASMRPRAAGSRGERDEPARVWRAGRRADHRAAGPALERLHACRGRVTDDKIGARSLRRQHLGATDRGREHRLDGRRGEPIDRGVHVTPERIGYGEDERALFRHARGAHHE